MCTCRFPEGVFLALKKEYRTVSALSKEVDRYRNVYSNDFVYDVQALLDFFIQEDVPLEQIFFVSEYLHPKIPIARTSVFNGIDVEEVELMELYCEIPPFSPAYLLYVPKPLWHCFEHVEVTG